MSPAERAPDADLLLAMAYADGELAPEARAAFEARLAREPALRAEVAAQQGLAILAREAAPAEPLELERLHVELRAPLRTLWLLGRALIVCAVVLLVAVAILALAGASLRLPLAVAALLFGLGLALLALRAWRVRRSTEHLDPYRHVKR